MQPKPVANACHRPFIRRRPGVWTVKHPNLLKENHRDPAPFALGDFGAQFQEEGFNITPVNVRAYGVRKYPGERRMVLSLQPMPLWYC
jgi:hypothetical protein